MPESYRILVDESSKTAEARRIARKMARAIGLDETLSEKVGLVATEACTNILKHAGRGELIVRSSIEGADMLVLLDVMALDQGPGLTNLSQALADGYSTTDTAGTGLGAIVRLSKHSDFYTVPQKGTALLARWWRQRNASTVPPIGTLQVRGVNLPKPGEEVSGDCWGSMLANDVLTILVADGLGHGIEAHKASSEAVRILQANPGMPPKMLLERVHQGLRATRGAAVAIASIDGAHRKVAFAGAGNVSARIYSGGRLSHSAVSVNGTAGLQCERLQEFSYPWPPDGLLQINTDGLTSGASLEPYPGLALRDPALIAGVLYRDFARGRDDSTVVIAKAA